MSDLTPEEIILVEVANICLKTRCNEVWDAFRWGREYEKVTGHARKKDGV